MDAQEIAKAKLENMGKVNLCFLPTPFEKMAKLSAQFKGVNLFFKRDDQTGLAMGGNKARKLEYIMADVRQQKATSIITWGGFHSNWCRQVAAAANICNVKPVLILLKKPGRSATAADDVTKRYSSHKEFSNKTKFMSNDSLEGSATAAGEVLNGNPLLDFLMDAEIHVREVGKDQKLIELAGIKEDIIDPVFKEEQEKGNNPYIAPIGGSLLEGSMLRPWGALGYVNAFVEVLEQAKSRQIPIDTVVVASGSSGTQAGLLAGAKIFSPETRVVGISVMADKATLNRYIETIADETFVELGVDMKIEEDDIIVFDEYTKEGYGVLNQEIASAIRLAAQSEGVLLDPVYTGKGMAGLTDLINKGYFRDGENIVFFHTGGTPSLFPYGSELKEFLSPTFL